MTAFTAQFLSASSYRQVSPLYFVKRSTKLRKTRDRARWRERSLAQRRWIALPGPVARLFKGTT
jgi:hypothetical protein